jgi:hypothetical protein
MDEKHKISRKQFLGALGSMVAAVAIAKVASIEKKVAAISTIATPKQTAGYGNSVYGGTQA